MMSNGDVEAYLARLRGRRVRLSTTFEAGSHRYEQIGVLGDVVRVRGELSLGRGARY